MSPIRECICIHRPIQSNVRKNNNKTYTVTDQLWKCSDNSFSFYLFFPTIHSTLVLRIHYTHPIQRHIFERRRHFRNTSLFVTLRDAQCKDQVPEMSGHATLKLQIQLVSGTHERRCRLSQTLARDWFVCDDRH